jgi:hypothetical protein
VLTCFHEQQLGAEEKCAVTVCSYLGQEPGLNFEGSGPRPPVGGPPTMIKNVCLVVAVCGM